MPSLISFSFYEDVFPEGFDPFDNSHDATVPETSLDLLSNSSSLFDEMADLSQKYDSIEPEEALFRLLREDDSAEKVSCDVGVHSPRQGQAQGHVGVTKAVQNWRSKDVSYIKGLFIFHFYSKTFNSDPNEVF